MEGSKHANDVLITVKFIIIVSQPPHWFGHVILPSSTQSSFKWQIPKSNKIPANVDNKLPGRLLWKCLSPLAIQLLSKVCRELKSAYLVKFIFGLVLAFGQQSLQIILKEDIAAIGVTVVAIQGTEMLRGVLIRSQGGGGSQGAGGSGIRAAVTASRVRWWAGVVVSSAIAGTIAILVTQIKAQIDLAIVVGDNILVSIRVTSSNRM